MLPPLSPRLGFALPLAPLTLNKTIAIFTFLLVIFAFSVQVADEMWLTRSSLSSSSQQRNMKAEKKSKQFRKELREGAMSRSKRATW